MGSVKYNIEHHGVVGPTIVVKMKPENVPKSTAKTVKSVAIPDTKSLKNMALGFPEELKLITNPKYIGPGEWCCIHTMSAAATTETTKKLFVFKMDVLSKTFPCINPCRIHIVAYLKENPIRKYWNIRDAEGRDIGIFRWGWKFHNTVSKRIMKPEMDWDTAFKLYYTDAGSCEAGCGGEEVLEEEVQSKREDTSSQQVSKRSETVPTKTFQSVSVGKNNSVNKLYYNIVPAS